MPAGKPTNLHGCGVVLRDYLIFMMPFLRSTSTDDNKSQWITECWVPVISLELADDFLFFSPSFLRLLDYMYIIVALTSLSR